MNSYGMPVVGSSVPRVDATEKIRGKARYVDDYNYRGTLNIAQVLSTQPHAEIGSINISEALATPGVVRVILAKDIPGQNQIGCVFPDQPLLAYDKVRFVGDRIALVVATTAAIAREAAAKVVVDYRTLPSVHDVSEALSDAAPRIQAGGNLVAHLKVRHGAGLVGMNEADVTVEQEFEVNYQEHAYLEPQGMLAVPFDKSVHVTGSLQAPAYVQSSVARVLGYNLAQVRVTQATTGGGFGGKEDYPSEVAACAALASILTNAPCKLIYTRAEDMQISTKRHRMRLHYKLGAKPDGTLHSIHATIQVDSGAYAGLSTVVAERSNSCATGPYKFPNVHIDTLVVYTNNLFGGAFRGFGTPQTTFAMENTMDLLAAKLGMDPVELRRKNMLQEGDMLVTGTPVPPSAPSIQVLDTLLQRSDYVALRQQAEEFNAQNHWAKRGVGLALSMYGCCLHAGGQHMEGSGALVQVRTDGSVEVTIGGAELGQGANTMAAQIAAHTLGAPYASVRSLPSDTGLVPDSGPTVASRTTVMSGNAVLDASKQIRQRLAAFAAGLWGVPEGDVVLEGGTYKAGANSLSFLELVKEANRRRIHLTASGWYAPPPKPWDKETGQGLAYVTYCFSGHVADVEVDLLSGLTKVRKIWAVHDVGKAINPAMLQGQAFGGMVQGMGWALSENLQLDHGKVLNPGFSDYLIPGALDVPKMDVAWIEDPYPDGPYGAKGIGEPSLITVPTAVAIAVGHASKRTPTRLPLTPETVLRWFGD